MPSEWARTFGGQIAAQSLMSAARTLDRSYAAHSLHGYFLRPGGGGDLHGDGVVPSWRRRIFPPGGHAGGAGT
ncbi:acyl-CoA thioesterase domain-containing protein [Streptomyces sp. NPDC051738]|uniref:acyl-CoA thioesterase domain-containing protein n=1 Tax=Streptomyces sp. NPDC051738 TaxID=3365672 RepID=UPI0037D0C4FA